MAQPGDTRAPSGGDWVVQATDTIENVVGTIRSKTTVPLTTIARGLVYGLVAGVVGIVALVLLTVGMIRALDVVLDFIPGIPEDVWVAYLLLGLLFSLGGLVLWSKRRAGDST